MPCWDGSAARSTASPISNRFANEDFALNRFGRRSNSGPRFSLIHGINCCVEPSATALFVNTEMAITVSSPPAINEFRAEQAVEALHAQLRHRALVRRDGDWTSCDVTELVPGDIVRLETGAIVPADMRLLDAVALECEESVLTGESLPVEKRREPVATGTSVSDLSSCALMGTRRATMPIRNSPTARSVVPTGRRMNGSEMDATTVSPRWLQQPGARTIQGRPAAPRSRSGD